MSEWYLQKLYETTDQPTLRFAFQGTVNWMRGLAILCKEQVFTDEKIKIFYSAVKRRNKNSEADLIVFENILMAIHNLHSLKLINTKIENPYSIARTQIISWYYSIYYASSAMIGAHSGNIQETHAGTAKVWQKDIVERLTMPPFNLSLSTLIEKDYKSAIQEMREGNSFDLNNYPKNQEEAFGALFSYLQGTASYKKGETEENIKRSQEFKNLGVDDFRTKVARELRDTKLEKGIVNFLVQAFRYRGKANYRDSVFLSYGNDRSDELKQFVLDLDTVATAFLKMASTYAKARVHKSDWDNFVADLETNLRFEFDTNILKI